MRVRKGTAKDMPGFLNLVTALAHYERLRPPSGEAKKRLARDVKNGRLKLLVAENQTKLVGYALYFFTYSSFLAKPTLYLEDIFVLEESRGMGAGFALFRRCVGEAVRTHCGRMEWSVLSWNKPAIGFYERIGAKRRSDWIVYRLDAKGLRKVPNAPG